ncbi:MAG: hypothetical protein M3137_02460, partial [Actinomycetota bacterium]|nr:hypothetical protein [Actinomycetota bacterium]
MAWPAEPTERAPCTAIARWFDPKRHRRAVLFTDDQQHDSGQVRLDHLPLVYTFNLAGYLPSALPAGERGRYTLGGFTDANFAAMKVLEDGATPHGRSDQASGPRQIPGSIAGSRSTVGKGVEGGADLSPSAVPEIAEPHGEHRSRDGSEVVEGGHAVVVDPLVGS